MKTLVVRQPWAWLIANGQKSIELRSWPTKYRGPLLIVAGSSLWKGEHAWPTSGPRGVELCVVELVDVRVARPEDENAACLAPPAEHYAWVLSSARPVEQRRHKGRLGLYETSDVVAAQH